MKTFGKLVILVTFFSLFGIFLTSNTSAFDHATYKVSESLNYDSHFSVSDKSFSLTKSADVSRITCYGYYDWSAKPKSCYTAQPQISQHESNLAFQTFQKDSKSFDELTKIKELRKKPYTVYGGRVIGYGHYYHKPYSSVYYW